MPPLAPAPFVCRINIGYKVGEDLNASSRFFVAYTGLAPSAAELTAWATAITGAEAGVKPFMSVQNSFEAVTIQDIGTDLGVEGVSTFPTTGTRAGLPVDASTSVVFQHRIARHYRGGKPKVYMPFGVADDLNDAQTWKGSFLGDLQTAWDAFRAAILTAAPAPLLPVQFVNVSYYQGSTAATTGGGAYVRGHTKLTPRIGGPVTDAILSSTARVKVGSQRRRNLA